MTTLCYAAFVRRREPGYHVTFPDLPDCSAMGATIQEAVANAEIGLAAHLADLRSRDIAVPHPTPLDALVHARDSEELVRVLVRAELPTRRMELTVSLDETLLAAIDAVSPDRSSFLENAARDLLRRRWGHSA